MNNKPINHYVQCAKCHIRRAYRRKHNSWEDSNFVYHHEGHPVYLVSECGSCRAERTERLRAVAVDKK